MISMHYGFVETPFGLILIAWIERGIVHVAFCDDERARALEILKRQWEDADYHENAVGAALMIEQTLFVRDAQSIKPILSGTDFQIKVWTALLDLPFGSVATYQDIAHAIGRPTAVRAVANAIAHNNIAFLVPCHRVIAKSGALAGYRWGVHRKKVLLDWEAHNK